MEPVIAQERRVSIRELFRKSADLFDQVELEQVSFVVTRDNRPVARLVPIDSNDAIERTGRRRITPETVEQSTGDEETTELTDLQKRLLLEIAARPGYGVTTEVLDEGVDAHTMALGMLELAGLTRLEWTGQMITPRGLRVAERLRATQDG